MATYLLTIYDQDGEPAAYGLDVPFLPYPGLQIIAARDIWKVIDVQVRVAERGSSAWHNNSPLHVAIIAERSPEIHPDAGEAGQEWTP